MRIFLWLCVFTTLILSLNFYLTPSSTGQEGQLKQITSNESDREELREGLERIYDKKKMDQGESKSNLFKIDSENQRRLQEELGENRHQFVYELVSRIRAGQFDQESSRGIFTEFRNIADKKPYETFQQLSDVVKLLPANSHEEFELFSLMSRIRDVQMPLSEQLVHNLTNAVPDENTDDSINSKVEKIYLAKIRFLIDIPMPKNEKNKIMAEIIEAQNNQMIKNQVREMLKLPSQEIPPLDRKDEGIDEESSN